MTRVAVLGSGAWGTTFAKVLADADPNTEVAVFARRAEIASEIRVGHRNASYLPGIALPANVTALSSLTDTARGAHQVYVAVPSQDARKLLASARADLAPDAVVVSLMKGVERKSQKRMSEVIMEATGRSADQVAVVSGPNLALEIARGEPTAAVIASASSHSAHSVARSTAASYLYTSVSDDVVGVEYGGVLKNLIALAVGIIDGVGYGENAKASLIMHGLGEMSAFVAAFGGQPETMLGPAGLGDLIATCESRLSRNATAGRLLGQGYSYREVVRQMKSVAEGLASVAPVLELAASRGVRMPITLQVSRVLTGELPPGKLAPLSANQYERQ